MKVHRGQGWTLLEGDCIGCEREPQYAEIVVYCLTHATRKP